MTDTKDTKAQPDEPVDPIPDELYTWGLSGRPLRMAWADHQPVVAAIRMANAGEGMTAAEVQPILDETFPDGDYVATDLVIAHPPVGTFTVTQEGDEDTVTIFTADDHDLDLPDDHIRWDFGDGTQAVGTKVEHQYGAADDYTVTLRVNVAGRPWASEQTYRHLGGPMPVVTALVPRQVTVGAPRKATVRVAGSNFDDGTVIVMDGADVATTVISDHELTTLVDPKTAEVGTIDVAVRQDGRLSNTLGFDVVPGVSTPTGGPTAEPTAVDGEEFDPGEHTVDDVVAYAEANPDQVDSLIGHEEVGKARVTLLEKLNAMNDDAD